MVKADIKRKTAIFPGRFQPLHNGHYHELKRLEDKYNLIVLIGSAQKQRTEDNPLSLAERKKALQACLPHVEMFGVKDVENDQQWVAEIETKVDFDLVVTGNTWTKRCFEPTGYKVKQPQFHQPQVFSGENIRQRIRQGKEWKELVPDCALEQLKRIDFSRIVINKKT